MSVRSVTEGLADTYGSSKDGYSEEALARLLQQGDVNAFGFACSHYHPRLLRTATRIMKDASDAQDAVQDAFLCAFKGMRSFKAASSVSTWLTRIVINSCFMQLRKRRKRPTSSLDAMIDDSVSFAELLQDDRVHTLNQMLTNERLQFLADAVDNLDPDVKQAIHMFQETDAPMKTRAERMQISLPALKSRIHRAKRSLRREYRQLAEAPLQSSTTTT